MPSALYLPLGTTDSVDAVLATALTSGPWRPDHQHGGPPSALLGRAMEKLVEPGQFLARISIELVKGVPLAELSVTRSVERVSGRVWRGTAEIHADGVLVAKARGLILKNTDIPEPAWTPAIEIGSRPDHAGPPPPRWTQGTDQISYHRHAVEHRFERGTFDGPGDAVDWVLLKYPVIEGESPSGLLRALAAADFGSGVSAVYDFESFGMINADIDVAFHRPVVGEWIRLSATTHIGPAGTGLCVTGLGDERGQVGIATQALLGFGSGQSAKVT